MFIGTIFSPLENTWFCWRTGCVFVSTLGSCLVSSFFTSILVSCLTDSGFVSVLGCSVEVAEFPGPGFPSVSISTKLLSIAISLVASAKNLVITPALEALSSTVVFSVSRVAITSSTFTNSPISNEDWYRIISLTFM